MSSVCTEFGKMEVPFAPHSKLSQTLASFFGREENSDGWFLFLLCFDKSKGSNVC